LELKISIEEKKWVNIEKYVENKLQSPSGIEHINITLRS
jgi:primosomal replication protein N